MKIEKINGLGNLLLCGCDETVWRFKQDDTQFSVYHFYHVHLSCLSNHHHSTIMIIERYGSEAHEMPGKKRLNLFLWSMSWMGQPKQHNHGERPWITAELRRCAVTRSNLARLIAGNRFMLCEMYQQTVSFDAEHSSSLQIVFQCQNTLQKGITKHLLSCNLVKKSSEEKKTFHRFSIWQAFSFMFAMLFLAQKQFSMPHFSCMPKRPRMNLWRDFMLHVSSSPGKSLETKCSNLFRNYSRLRIIIKCLFFHFRWS